MIYGLLLGTAHGSAHARFSWGILGLNMTMLLLITVWTTHTTVFILVFYILHATWGVQPFTLQFSLFWLVFSATTGGHVVQSHTVFYVQMAFHAQFGRWSMTSAWFEHMGASGHCGVKIHVESKN